MQFCSFYKKQAISVGLIKNADKKKISVIDMTSKEIDLINSQIICIWQDHTLQGQTDVQAILQDILKKAQDYAGKIDLKTIYELSQANMNYSLEELSQEYLNLEKAPWHKLALYISLENEEFLFRKKKKDYIKRTDEEINQYKKIKEREQKIIQREAQEKLWFIELLKKKKIEVASEDTESWYNFLERLKSFAIHLDSHPESSYFFSLLNNTVDHYSSIEKKLVSILNQTPISIPWEKLLLSRTHAFKEWNEQTILEVEKTISSFNNILQNKNISQNIEDHRNKFIITIDNKETTDFDDAICIEIKDDSYLLSMYITDVASFIDFNGNLFSQIEKRAVSIYSPKQKFNMMPTELAESFFALKKNEEKITFCFCWEFDHHFSIIDTTIKRALIQVNANLTYDEVDLKIKNNEEEFLITYQICQQFFLTRKQQGALQFERKEVHIDFSNEDKIKITPKSVNSIARFCIEELSIQANFLAAQFTQENNLKNIYRFQEEYQIKKNIEDPNSIKKKDVIMKAVKISTYPEKHFGLGLSCYTQVTSPIRRLSDLVTQKIILDYFTNSKNQFDENKLLYISSHYGRVSKEIQSIERKLYDELKIKYLSQNLGLTFHFEIIREMNENVAIVLLDEIQFTTEITIHKKNLLLIKKLKIIEVDLETNNLKFEFIE